MVVRVLEGEACGGVGVADGVGGVVFRVMGVETGGFSSAKKGFGLPGVVRIGGFEGLTVPNFDEFIFRTGYKPFFVEAKVENGFFVCFGDGVQLFTSGKTPDYDVGVGGTGDDDVFFGGLVELETQH